jgi:hypothetical protein
MKVFAYIHPEINILCCALFKEYVPQGVEAVELDVETPDDVILDNGEIRIKTEAEKLAEAKQLKLSQLKSYTASLLSPTDYIITKIYEAQLLNDNDQVEALKQKYSSQLQERENIRAWNEKVKQAINNATTIEELNSVEIKFEGGN